jgi:hypothetical protein
VQDVEERRAGLELLDSASVAVEVGFSLAGLPFRGPEPGLGTLRARPIPFAGAGGLHTEAFSALGIWGLSGPSEDEAKGQPMSQ